MYKVCQEDEMMRKQLRKKSGFTLIELIIAIGMISILTAIAIPNVMSWLPNYRLKAAARDLYSNMQKAKMEAVKSNKDVLIGFVVGTYDPAGVIGSYQVFVDDSPANGAFDAGEQVLVQVNMPKNVSMYYNNFTDDTAGYNSRGLPWTYNLGSVRFQNNNSRYYQASLSFAGNVKIKTSNDGETWN
jgi:type IV fimbrial biogenesis protein FimT